MSLVSYTPTPVYTMETIPCIQWARGPDLDLRSEELTCWSLKRNAEWLSRPYVGLRVFAW